LSTLGLIWRVEVMMYCDAATLVPVKATNNASHATALRLMIEGIRDMSGPATLLLECVEA
jgi:hypothetical protein